MTGKCRRHCETKSLGQSVLLRLNSVDDVHRTVIGLSDIRGYPIRKIADKLRIL